MRQTRWVRTVIWALGVVLLLGGCAGADAPGVEQPRPEPGPTAPATNPTDDPSKPDESRGPATPAPELPGDMEALNAALSEPSAITYTIAIADAPKGMDKTEYLDTWLEEKGYPHEHEVLLVIFPEDNHDIRFAMGSLLFERKVSLQSMLQLVRDKYLTKARAGDPAGGLASLMRSLNQLVK